MEWSRQIDALRTGELRLLAPEEGGLSQFARGHFDDLKEYTKALEHGYRAVCEKLDGYRKHERTSSVKCGRKTMGELLANQWSDEAALGYAAIALRMAHILPGKAVEVLETMEDVMASTNRCEAEDAIMMYKAARMDDGGTQA